MQNYKWNSSQLDIETQSLTVKRSDVQIKANPKRVIINYLCLGINQLSERIQRLISDLISIPEEEVDNLYDEVKKNFEFRHRNFEYYVKKNFDKIQAGIPSETVLSITKKLLIGTYFSKEYSIQSAALFNPSMVAHPDQSGLKEGEKRFIISLRSVGEGHISSIEFRTGIVDKEGNIDLDKTTGFASCSEKNLTKIYSRNNLIKNTQLLRDFDASILDVLEEHFIYADYLKKVDANAFSAFDEASQEQLFRILDTNYDLTIDEQSSICERVIFPNAAGESMGMEDVRFVAFKEADNTRYIGTYTAYNGHQISPQLIMTSDFVNFEVRTMYGDAVSDKGMALFPEKIDGKYVMLGRQGGEAISIMYSDDLFIWRDYKVIMTPENTWSYVQLGNCGSPLKTQEGWLVVTHAVGSLRKYILSAILLDINNPSKIIKKLNKPLLSPNEEEREGYVPNVVYSCGSMLHEGNLILPYAMSDSASTFAAINVAALINEMEVYEN